MRHRGALAVGLAIIIVCCAGAGKHRHRGHARRASSPAKRHVHKAPRGIRNHNPGNIVKSGRKWDGQAGNDGRFVKFKSAEHGIQAVGELLLRYQDDGRNTIAKIITRWAPPRENNTKAYIAAVAKSTGYKAGQKLDLNNPEVLFRVARAIIEHENGAGHYSDQTIRAGVALALAD